MSLAYIVIGVWFVVLGNVLIYKLLVKRTVRKKIIPYLSSLECEFVEMKSYGFFNAGNFKTESSNIVNPNGEINLSIYQKLTYKDKKGSYKQTSVRINSVTLFLTEVYYRPEI